MSTTGINRVDGSRFSSRHVSNPSIPGIITSSSTRSGGLLRIWRSASSPDDAPCTMWPSRVRRRIISETFSCWSSTTRMRPGSELAPGSSSAAIVPREHRDHDGPELPNQTTCFHVSPESPAMVFESRSHFGVAANAPASSAFPAIARVLHPAENALACQERRSGGCSVWHTPAIRKSNRSAV